MSVIGMDSEYDLFAAYVNFEIKVKSERTTLGYRDVNDSLFLRF